MSSDVIIIFGDSTCDTGNLSSVAKALGLANPFKDQIYDGGGNTKASDGLVLSEHFGVEIGWDGKLIDNINYLIHLLKTSENLG